MKKVIDVSTDLVNYLERLDYDQQATRFLLIDAVERGLDNGATFERWEQKYRESYAAFCVAKAEVEREYVLPLFGDKKVAWNLDYHTCKLTVVEE